MSIPKKEILTWLRHAITGMGEPKSTAKRIGEVIGVATLVYLWLNLCSDIFASFSNALYKSATHLDAQGQLWMVWWAEKAMADPALSLYHCPWINAPAGGPVFTFDVAYFQILFAALIKPAFGLVGAINFVFCVNVAVGLAGVYLLLRQLIRSPFFAAMLAYLPVHQRLFYHGYFVDIDQANIGWMALTIAFWLSWIKERSTWRWCAALFFATITAVLNMYYGINVFGFMIVAVLLSFLKLSPVPEPNKVPKLGTIFLVGLSMAFTVPLLWPSVAQLGATSGALLGGDSNNVVLLFSANVSVLLALPILVVALLIVDRTYRGFHFWFAMSAVFLVLALGAVLRIHTGDASGIPMPLLLAYKYIPFFTRYTSPQHFVLPAYLSTICLCAMMLNRVAEKTKGLTIIAISAVLIYSVGSLAMGVVEEKDMSILVEPEMVLFDSLPAVPKYYREKNDGIVFDLPCEQEAAWPAYYQVFHQRPVAGYPLIPDPYLPKKGASELTKLQGELVRQVGDGKVPQLPSREFFAEKGVTTLALHHQCVTPELAVAWQAAYGKPVERTQEVSLYLIEAEK